MLKKVNQKFEYNKKRNFKLITPCCKRSNKDGSIDLHSYQVIFKHPVTKNTINIKAPLPIREPWKSFLYD